MSAHTSRSSASNPRPFGLRSDLRAAYAEFYSDNDATHELTISLGLHPRRFDPETEFIPQMRRIVREIAHHLRGVPKRRLLKLRPVDAPWMAGFYEHTDASGMIFPHWHGVISLRPGEQAPLRHLLTECVGRDGSEGANLFAPETTRPLVTVRGAKPTFHLAPLTTPERFVSYAAKKARNADVIHWTTADLL